MSFRGALAGILHTVACRHDPRVRLLPHLAIVRSSYVTCNQDSVLHYGEGQPVVSGSVPDEVHDGISVDDSSKRRGLTSPPEGEKQASFSLSDSDEKMEFTGAPAQDRVRVDEKKYPRPAEIPWQAKVANSVNLIGRVGVPVHLETFPDGSAYSIAILEQKKAPNFPQLWIPVIFEGDLAGIAACHLKEDDRIHVSGQLSADSPQIVIEDRISTIHVMAQSLSFIQEKPEGGMTEPLHKRLPDATRMADKSGIGGLKISESHWDDFLTNPHNWWDARHDKVNPRSPDFIHKEYNRALWLRESTPLQVHLSLKDSVFCQKLEQLDTDKSSIRGLKISESHWDDFLRNPHNWWDARQDKVHPRRPDFIHKEYNLSLWLGESTPSQVLLSLKDSVFCQKLEQSDTGKRMGLLWDDLLSNPGNWEDLRNSKTKTNQPDFKHKISGRALWIGETTPPPVMLALHSPDFCAKLIKRKTAEDSWKDLIDNPDMWWDNRSTKTNPRAPDFRHKESGEALWLDGSPDWARSKFSTGQ